MRTVEKRCDTRMVMRPLAHARSRAPRRRSARTARARSRRRARPSARRAPAAAAASRMKPRASASFCHWPNDTSTPSGHVGPSCVSSPDGSRATTSSAPARSTAAMHRRLVVEPRHVAEADGVPRAELEAEEILERARQRVAPRVRAACARAARRRRRIAPDVGSYIFASSLTSVVLPAPFSPTIATTAPAGQVEVHVVEHEPLDVPG